MRNKGTWFVLLITFALLGQCAFGAEWHFAAAKTIPTKNAESTGILALGLRGDRYDVTLSYVNETTLYGGAADVPSFAMLSVSRVWRFTDTRLLGGIPTALVGLSLKGADRCAKEGEVDCNRVLPLPAAFHFGAGVEWGEFRIELYHDSNNHLDYGPEKKNRGLNWISLQKRW